MRIVLDILICTAYVTAALVWCGVFLITGSLLWASWKQRRQERRERNRPQSAPSYDNKISILEARADGNANRIMDHEQRVKRLELILAKPQPEAKKCSSKRKN